MYNDMRICLKKKMLKIQKNRNKINVKYNKDFRIRNNEEIAIQFWNVSSVSLELSPRILG